MRGIADSWLEEFSSGQVLSVLCESLRILSEGVMATRGFTGRRPLKGTSDRVPPGQSVTDGFPVLSATPTPHIPLDQWSFTLKVGPKPVASWNWEQFNALPQTQYKRDIHCVTKWSKLDTTWEGVAIDDLLA